MVIKTCAAFCLVLIGVGIVVNIETIKTVSDWLFLLGLFIIFLSAILK